MSSVSFPVLGGLRRLFVCIATLLLLCLLPLVGEADTLPGGSTIASAFSDPEMAEIIRVTLGYPNVTTTITQSDVDGITSLSINNNSTITS